MEIINMGGQISSADFGQFSVGVYMHNRPVEITVSHGTNSYTWIGDFFNVDSLHSMVLYNYSTSTVIKVKGGGTSYKYQQ